MLTLIMDSSMEEPGLDDTPLLVDNMKMVRVLFHNFKVSILNEMAHKINFIMRFLSDSIYFVIYYIFYTVIFSYVPNINGWGKYEVLLLMGTFHIIISLFLGVFFPNLIQIPALVKSGQLDSYIVKPVNSQLLVSTRSIDGGSLMNVALGIAIICNSVIQLQLSLTLKVILLFLFYIMVGTLIMYSVLFIMLSTIFWLQDSSWSIGFFMTFNSFADKPVSIYKGLVYRFLVFIFPIGLVANIPASILLNNTDTNLQAWILIAAVTLLYLSKKIWKKGITLYEGASI